jgi:iron transport multicopper oxidase
VPDPDDPLKDLYDVDDETTIIQLGDWYHRPTSVLLAEYFSVRPFPPVS